MIRHILALLGFTIAISISGAVGATEQVEDKTSANAVSSDAENSGIDPSTELSARGPASAMADSNDPNFAIKVKKKMYPGGSEEGDLKVQSQLVTPTRRFAPVQNQESEPHEPASND